MTRLKQKLIIPLSILLTGCGLFSPDDKEIKLRRLTENGGEYPTWSGDGKTIVYADDGDLWSVPAGGGEQSQLTDLEGTAVFPEFLRVPGGTRYAFIYYEYPHGARPVIGELGDDEYSFIRPVEFYISMGSIAWTPDGSHLLFITYLDYDPIRMVPVGGGETVTIDNRSGWRLVNDVQCMVGEDRVVYIEEEEDITTNVFSIPIEGGEPYQLTGYVYLIGLHSIDISWDGGRLALATSRNETRNYSLWTKKLSDPTDRSYTRITGDDDGRVRYPSWSPDGRHIAYGAETSGVSEIWVADLP